VASAEELEIGQRFHEDFDWVVPQAVQCGRYCEV